MGAGRGGGGFPLGLAWSPGSWKMAGDGGMSLGRTCPGPGFWHPVWAMPAVPFLPRRPVSLWEFTQRKSPVLHPRLPGPPPQPLGRRGSRTSSWPRGSPALNRPMARPLWPAPFGASAPRAPLPLPGVRPGLSCWARTKGRDFPVPRPSVCSWGPAWPVPRDQPAALFLKTGPRLGCLMTFSWRSSAALKFHLHGQAGPGLAYRRLAGGLG